jgi:hypothetical protein
MFVLWMIIWTLRAEERRNDRKWEQKSLKRLKMWRWCEINFTLLFISTLSFSTFHVVVIPWDEKLSRIFHLVNLMNNIQNALKVNEKKRKTFSFLTHNLSHQIIELRFCVGVIVICNNNRNQLKRRVKSVRCCHFLNLWCVLSHFRRFCLLFFIRIVGESHEVEIQVFIINKNKNKNLTA